MIHDNFYWVYSHLPLFDYRINRHYLSLSIQGWLFYRFFIFAFLSESPRLDTKRHIHLKEMHSKGNPESTSRHPLLEFRPNISEGHNNGDGSLKTATGELYPSPRTMPVCSLEMTQPHLQPPLGRYEMPSHSSPESACHYGTYNSNGTLSSSHRYGHLQIATHLLAGDEANTFMAIWDDVIILTLPFTSGSSSVLLCSPNQLPLLPLHSSTQHHLWFFLCLWIRIKCTLSSKQWPKIATAHSWFQMLHK